VKIADRVRKIGNQKTGFELMSAIERIEKKGHKVIKLQIGEPDFNTPENIVQAGIKALKEGYTHYSPSSGIEELKEAVINYIYSTRKIKYQKENIVVTPGAKPVIFMSIMALIEPGDEVIYFEPAFPAYKAIVAFAGGVPVPIQLKKQENFRIDIEKLKSSITKKTKLLILNSPNNPTGAVITKEENLKIAELAFKHNLMVLSDEIYSRIIYDNLNYHSIASIPGMEEHTILVEGFSKSYAMTGWRLGYGCMPKFLASAITKIITNSNSCTATFVQRAGIEALTGSQKCIEKMVQEFKKRRNRIVELINEVPGFSCDTPSGAFYVFTDISQTNMSSTEMMEFLLENAYVACLPGVTFGNYGEGFIRFSYANSIENIEVALDRIKEVVSKL